MRDNSIGGFFQLDLESTNDVFHNEALAVNSGRNALELILKNLDVQLVYISYYTCDVLLEPIKKLGLKFAFYELDQNLCPKLDNLNENEVLIYTNYFGILTDTVSLISSKFDNVIIDNAQAFYDVALKNASSFYSPRKFFGVCDGGFAYVENGEAYLDTNIEIDISIERSQYLLNSLDVGKEEVYDEFLSAENSLKNQEVKKMSKLTKALLGNVDFELIRASRNSNFWYLHQFLKDTNELSHLIDTKGFVCPMVYPYLNKNGENLRPKLIEKKLFVPQYWPNVKSWNVHNLKLEKNLFNNLLPLPIDQRYSSVEMNRIIEIINLGLLTLK